MPAFRRTSLLVVFAVAVAAAAFVIPGPLACPVVIPPQPLRTLYKFSDRVVVARVGLTETVEADGNSMLLKTALHVAEDVKGGGESVAYVFHRVWPDEGGVEMPSAYTQGEKLLVFLDRRKGGAGYEVNDENFGLKKLSDDDLKVYVKRIEELAALSAQEPPDTAALVEWLVRCAEEPATRWEGAYELMLSAGAAEREDEDDQSAAGDDRDGEGEAVSGEGEATSRPAVIVSADADDGSGVQPAEADSAGNQPSEEAGAEGTRQTADGVEIRGFALPDRFVKPDLALVAALNDEQKRRLADALFSTEVMGEGESALLQVVKDFEDERLPSFIVAQLRRVENYPPPDAESWLDVLAETLDNEEVEKLARRYTGNVTYYEEEVTGDGGPADESDEEEVIDSREAEARMAAAEERAARKRSAMLRELLTQVERILASGEVARS